MKPKPNIHRPASLLAKARKLLGLRASTKKREVFEAAAARLNVPVPSTKERGYRLLMQLCDPKQTAPAGDVNSIEFLESYEWRKLRMQVLVKRGARCECCGATPKDGIRIHVDHVKPRRLFPALALEESNLQVLCEVCNHGKGSWDQTDWRPKAEAPKKPAPRLSAALNMKPRLVKRA